jgi:hypothetical protein
VIGTPSGIAYWRSPATVFHPAAGGSFGTMARGFIGRSSKLAPKAGFIAQNRDRALDSGDQWKAAHVSQEAAPEAREEHTA